MTPPIPSCEPDLLYAGDTSKWTKMLGDYPSTDGWTLAYSFQGPSALADVTAAPSGSGYAVTISAALTGALTPGTYHWSARVTKAGETYTAARGVFTVVAVSGAVVVPYEEQVLAAIKATITGRATADLNQYAIGGRSVTKMTPDELLKWQAIYERKVWRLRNPGKVGVPIFVGFGPTGGQIGTPEPVSLPPWFHNGGG